MLKKDSIAAFVRDFNGKMVEFNELLVEKQDEVEADADEVMPKACNILNDLGKDARCSVSAFMVRSINKASSIKGAGRCLCLFGKSGRRNCGYGLK